MFIHVLNVNLDERQWAQAYLPPKTGRVGVGAADTVSTPVFFVVLSGPQTYEAKHQTFEATVLNCSGGGKFQLLGGKPFGHLKSYFVS